MTTRVPKETRSATRPNSMMSRSWIMSRVPQRDTSIEITLRSSLHRRGFRFKVQNRGLPGSPDIVLPKYRAAIFVHGCFWHRHGCQRTTTPSSNITFWTKKFEANVRRDALVIHQLGEQGWRVLTVWECALRGRNAPLERTIDKVVEWLEGTTAVAHVPQPDIPSRG